MSDTIRWKDSVGKSPTPNVTFLILYFSSYRFDLIVDAWRRRGKTSERISASGLCRWLTERNRSHAATAAQLPRASKPPVLQQQKKKARLAGGGVCLLRSATSASPSTSTCEMPGDRKSV